MSSFFCTVHVMPLKILKARFHQHQHLTGDLPTSNEEPEAKTFVEGEALLQLCCTPCQEKALQAILEAISNISSSNCHWATKISKRGVGESEKRTKNDGFICFEAGLSKKKTS